MLYQKQFLFSAYIFLEALGGRIFCLMDYTACLASSCLNKLNQTLFLTLKIFHTKPYDTAQTSPPPLHPSIGRPRSATAATTTTLQNPCPTPSPKPPPSNGRAA